MKIVSIFSLFSLLLISINSNAQVGIMTETPQTTLQIQKSSVNNLNNNNVADGILPPVMTKQELANKAAGVYGANQNGTIVYVNDATDSTSGASVSQVINVKKKGYYRFDGTQWVGMESTVSSHYSLYDIIFTSQPTVANIYNDGNGDGSLVNNLTIDLGYPQTTITLPPHTDMAVLCNATMRFRADAMTQDQMNAFKANGVIGGTFWVGNLTTGDVSNAVIRGEAPNSRVNYTGGHWLFYSGISLSDWCTVSNTTDTNQQVLLTFYAAATYATNNFINMNTSSNVIYTVYTKSNL